MKYSRWTLLCTRIVYVWCYSLPSSMSFTVWYVHLSISALISSKTSSTNARCLGCCDMINSPNRYIPIPCKIPSNSQSITQCVKQSANQSVGYSITMLWPSLWSTWRTNERTNERTIGRKSRTNEWKKMKINQQTEKRQVLGQFSIFCATSHLYCQILSYGAVFNIWNDLIASLIQKKLEYIKLVQLILYSM